jgi:hypothetical protein
MQLKDMIRVMTGCELLSTDANTDRLQVVA